MKTIPAVIICTVLLAFPATTPAYAALGSIDRACRKADRNAASPKLCGCIQKVADSSLNRRERYTVSKWFENPQKAQDTRQSKRQSDKKLWLRYKAFGERARRTCG